MSESVVTDEHAAPSSRATPLGRRLGLLADIAFYVAAAVFMAILSRYYVTGAGGPTQLAVIGVPMTIVIVVLNDLRHGDFYPRLGLVAPYAIALVFIAVSLYAIHYLTSEFDAIRIYRIGTWNMHDLAVGGSIVALILEYTRRRYTTLFFVILLLVLYTVYGYMVPGLFNHPGMRWSRVVSSMSVEFSTGVFERLSQLGLTLIGSFLLVLATLRAFGCIDSILLGSSRLAARSPSLLPQSAVIGSFGVAAVSGSGAANVATTGSATIPILIRAGFPRVMAGAVETSSSLGGQLMPPLMGIAAFLMADYLQVSYFEVVARGFAPAFIYFFGVAFAVFLIALRYHRRMVTPDVQPLDLASKLKILAYFLAVLGLIYLMGVERRAPMSSAQIVFVYLTGFLFAVHLLGLYNTSAFSPRNIVRPFIKLLESFATITAELVILLATLGILTAMFTITGVPTKVGTVLMNAASINLVLMVLTAFAFGYLVGMGLPVSPTYIITAVVVAPFLIRAGFEPWTVHFFVFFVAVFGELSPPTSVTAAVASRIADAPFIQTMMVAVVMCMPLMVMMGAVFTRPELVVEPGLAQLPAFLLILIGTLSLSFVFQGQFQRSKALDRALRAFLALLAVLAIFHPDRLVATIAAVLATAMVIWGIFRISHLMTSGEEAKPLEESEAPA